MYLPTRIENARVLVTVKTYPQPSQKYEELVCNAGFVLGDDEKWKWVRIYPVQFRRLPYAQQYRKYEWIELNLKRKWDDYRQESYMPELGVDESIKPGNAISTQKDPFWNERKQYVLREVYDSMSELIARAKTPHVWKSLATVKPKELIGLEIVEETEREWDPKFRAELKQRGLFEFAPKSRDRPLQIVRKLPFKYYYRFLTEGDQRPRRMKIEDWEIGALYWKCWARTNGDEFEANEQVRRKYEEAFFKKDLYLYVGTTKANHHRAPNPFMIIGVFYPPAPPVSVPPPVSVQGSLFQENSMS